MRPTRFLAPPSNLCTRVRALFKNVPGTKVGHLVLFALLVSASLAAQTSNSGESKPMTYYLPDLEYNPDITTPEEFLGWQIGDWHISHDLQQAYIRLLASQSDRMTLEVIGHTYEDRPLLNLIVTSPQNQGRLEELRTRHQQWNVRNGGVNANEINTVPAVLYQGFSIHGNEPSGGNAAPLVAYYLAAAPYAAVEKVLEDNIVLFDPCYNPDGFNRFASWVNSHKNKSLTADENDREYTEPYPRGRTNHYWFDLNRDWLPVQHPESRARIEQFHEWKPNVLTDHHEMGKDATFFFMPGEPTRVHPMTPKINQELTYKIGQYHADALDEIGSLYYSGEGYDDFYYGKGSTYPDINGCVGILFEQASSRGHVQETENGLLTFPFTVRNQVATALSTLKAFGNLRDDLLNYQREFNQGNFAGSTGYLVNTDGDQGRARELMELLRRHDVPMQQNGDGREVKEFFVYETPFSKAVFEPISEFEDSLFYDVSTFVLPYAFNLPYEKVSGGLPRGGDWMPTGGTTQGNNVIGTTQAEYAYLLPLDDYYSAKALYKLLDEGLIVKVSDQPFTVNGREVASGAIIVPVENNQALPPDALFRTIAEIEGETGLAFMPLKSGRVAKGLMLGSRSAYQTLRKPEIALIIDGGTSSLEVADAWHLLDQRFNIPVTKIPMDQVGRSDLSRYNTIIMVDGSYRDLGSAGNDAIKDWLDNEKVLITLKRAGQWAKSVGVAKVNTSSATDPDKDQTGRLPYARADRDSGGKVLGGAIYQATGDLTHPLLFGFQRADIPVFKRSTLLFDMPENRYASPLTYGKDALLSGYSPRGFEADLDGTAGIIVSGYNGGRVISFADNPNFRAFWYGTNRLFMNAIMFGNTISGRTVE